MCVLRLNDTLQSFVVFCSSVCQWILSNEHAKKLLMQAMLWYTLPVKVEEFFYVCIVL